MALRRWIRWAVRHGLARFMMQHQMRAGDLISRLLMDPAVRKDPFACYDQLRARGQFVSTGFAPITAHHEVCQAVLRNPDFSQMSFYHLFGTLRLGMKIAGRPVLSPLETPSMLVADPPDHT